MEVQQKIVYSLVIPEMVNGMIYDAQIGLNLFASAGMHDFEYSYPNDDSLKTTSPQEDNLQRR
jgi:hypothetical protein